jgi:formyl-CoA transferase
MIVPLSGIRVVDLTRALAGPYCSLMLADAGAEVYKVELPGTGDESRTWGPPFVNGESTYFLSINRSKKSLTLNLKNDKGREALRRLLSTADVFLENFTPTTIDRLGFGYDAVRQINPRIVFCSISGFGQDGPGRDRAAYDLIVQGMSGIMSVTGEPGRTPLRAGVPIADITAGMFAAYAIMLALFHRERSGEGMYVDASMLEAQASLLTYQAGSYFATGAPPMPVGTRHPSIAPYESLRTADGYINVAVGNDSLWQRFCAALGLEDLAADERMATNPGRLRHREEMSDRLERRLVELKTGEAVELLAAAGVPCGPILTLDQVFADPQAEHMGLRQRMEHPSAGKISQVPAPYRLHRQPPAPMSPPPTLGQHTAEILRQIGYAEDEIDALYAEGAL